MAGLQSLPKMRQMNHRWNRQMIRQSFHRCLMNRHLIQNFQTIRY